MENKKCDLIKDLIPLYTDDLCSDYSKRIMDEHIANCSKCKQLVRNKSIEKNVQNNENSELAPKIHKILKKRRTIITFLTTAIAALILIFLFCNFFLIGHYTTPKNVTIENITQHDGLTFFVDLNTTSKLTSISGAKYIRASKGIVYIFPQYVWASPFHPHKPLDYGFGFDEAAFGSNEILEIYISDWKRENPIKIWAKE